MTDNTCALAQGAHSLQAQAHESFYTQIQGTRNDILFASSR